MNKTYFLFNVLFQKLFLKKRYLFRLFKEQHIKKELKLDNTFSLYIFKSKTDIEDSCEVKTIVSFIENKIGKHATSLRINNPYWICFLVAKSKPFVPAGIGWLVCPPNKPYWYDNLHSNFDECRFANDYVVPEYRGKHIAQYINQERLDYAFNSGFNSVSVIVEAYRKPAVHNQKKVSRLVGKNYLIKLFGINIISVLKETAKTKAWYIGPFKRRKWLF